jgi:hypothetical protein
MGCIVKVNIVASIYNTPMRCFGLVVFVSILAGTACLFEKRLAVENALIRLREIRKAESVFREKHGRFGTLEELKRADLIPERIVDGEDFGYRFLLTLDRSGYRVRADPHGDIGSSFFMDQTGVIRASLKYDVPADQYSAPIKKQ